MERRQAVSLAGLALAVAELGTDSELLRTPPVVVAAKNRR